MSVKTSQTHQISRMWLPGTIQGGRKIFSLDTINELKIYTLFYTVQKFAGDYLHMTFPLIYSLDYIPKTEEEDIVFTLAMVIIGIDHVFKIFLPI